MIITIYLGIIATYCVVSALYHIVRLFGYEPKLEKSRVDPPPTPPPRVETIVGRSNYQLRRTTTQVASTRDTIVRGCGKEENQFEIDLDNEIDDITPKDYDPTMQASGVLLSEIQGAITTLQNPNSSFNDRMSAGETFSRIEGSTIIDQLTNSGGLKAKIARLLDSYEREGGETPTIDAIKLTAEAEKFNIEDHI